jgi:hypothetical protein
LRIVPYVAIGAAVLVLAACATAPIGPYRGPIPSSLAVRAFAGGAEPSLVAGTTDRSAHRLGTLASGRGADSLVLLIYGDNRPGPQLLTTPWGMGAMADADWRDPVSLLWAAVNVPVLLVQAVVPTLDGFQDLLSSKVTHVYRGGGEARVLKALERERDASLVINTGDLVENGKRGVNWERFVQRDGSLARRVPFLAAPGNHERLGDPLGRFNWNAVVGVPADTLRYWYTLDLPDSLARFVFLDSNVFVDPKHQYPDSLETAVVEEQIAWLDRALESPARWTFVVLHHPIVSAGQHFSDWALDDSSAAGRRGRLIAALARHHVTAVFAGHEHLYQRLWLQTPGGTGFWQLTTGGGGSPLHRISKLERRDATRARLPGDLRVAWSQPHSVYHYCRLVLPAKPGAGSPSLEVRRVLRDGSTRVIEWVDLGARPKGNG